MKVEKVKETDRTITVNIFLVDKILQLRIYASKHLMLYLWIKRKFHKEKVLYLQDFADIVWKLVDIRKDCIFNKFDLLAYMGAKVPDKYNLTSPVIIRRKRNGNIYRMDKGNRVS